MLARAHVSARALVRTRQTQTDTAPFFPWQSRSMPARERRPSRRAQPVEAVFFLKKKEGRAGPALGERRLGGELPPRVGLQRVELALVVLLRRYPDVKLWP